MSNRKIWAIPIAAFAMALMFAVLWMTESPSGIEAQTPATPTTPYVDKTNHMAVIKNITSSNGSAPGNVQGQYVVTIKNFTTSGENLDALATPVAGGNPVLTGADAGKFVFAMVENGENRDFTLYPKTTTAAGTYSLGATIKIDTDSSGDSNGNNDNADDVDVTINLTFNVYVVGISNQGTTTRTRFHADVDQVRLDARVSTFGRDLNDNPLAFVVSGMPPNGKVLLTDGKVGTDEDTNLDFVLHPDDSSKIIAKVNAVPAAVGDIDFTVSIDTDTTKDGPDGDSQNPDTITDNDPDLTFEIDAQLVDATALSWDTDAPPYEFVMTTNHAANTSVGAISVDGAVLNPDAVDTTSDNEALDGILLNADGTQTSVFKIMDVTSTTVDGQKLQIIYAGNGLTPGIHAFRVSVNGDTGLAQRTISGYGVDSQNNAIAPKDPKQPLANLFITVNPGNMGHELTMNKFSKTVMENDTGKTNLLKKGSTVADLSSLIKSNADNDPLTYTPSGTGSTNFTFSAPSGGGDASVLKVGSLPIVAATPVATSFAGNSTTDAVANVTKYTYSFGPRTDGGMYSADGGTTLSASCKYVAEYPITNPVTPRLAADIKRDATAANAKCLYEDIYYKFKVKIGDGVTANDETVDVTVKVNVNQPPTFSPPSGTTMNADGQYEFTAEAVQGAFASPLLDLDALFPNAADESTDKNSYTLVARPVVSTVVPAPTPIAVPSDLGVNSKGELELRNVQPPSNGRTIERIVRINVEDAYMETEVKDTNGNVTTAEVPDLDYTFKITIDVKTPALDFVTFEIDEDAAVGDAVGSVKAADHADDYSYIIVGESKNRNAAGARFYDLDTATGAITVASALDYEAAAADNGTQTTLVVQVRKAGVNGAVATITAQVVVQDVNEAPTFGAAPSLSISEKAQVGTNVGAPIAASDVDAGDMISYSIKETDVPFSVMKTDMGGQIQVAGALDIADSPYSVTLVATDDGGLTAELALSIEVGDENDAPMFDTPYMTEFKVNEQDSAAAEDLATYNATDVDGTDALQGVKFVLTDSDDARHFVMTNQTSDAGEHEGVLSVKAGANLDVDAAGTKSEYELLLAVCDKLNACSEKIDITVTITPQNDNAPVINSGARDHEVVDENTARGIAIGNYSATDADGDAITYSLSGADSKSFSISDAGMLMTLEALDADGAKTPCGDTGCEIKVIASDGEKSDEMAVKITVNGEEDSVSNFTVKKANPIADISSDGDDAMSALADGKTTMSKMVPESPSDLPAMSGGALDTFVTADWASWGTVLRIEVTAQSPAANCGNGNQCVYVDVEGKDSDHKLTLTAYRSSEMDNKFVTAVKVVKKGEGTDDTDPNDDDKTVPVYMHNGGGVAQLEAEEEDEIEIRLAGSKIAPRTVQVENEAPEFGNFMPEHEAAYDDGDVDYTFTITDSVSGIPEPEDLPDNDGNSDYMPLVALVSGSQCHTADPNDKEKYAMYDFAGNSVWCMSKPEIRAVTDDRDFDEIDDGFEVETTIVLDANENHWVTFVVCDAAGNCELYTPDENKTDEALPLITIDTEDPVLVEARTGIMWDETDEELDNNNPTWIQVIFEDLSPLNDGTVEADDFVVQGHTVKEAKRYEDDADEGNRRMVFLELEDELAPDEEPEVTLVPNGVADIAGNDQDEGEVDAKDYIAPSFTVVSMVSPGTPDGSSNVLAGDGDEVVISITADERIRKTQPDVTITHVNAPAGCVETSVDRSKLTAKGDGSTYARGEIILAGDKEGCDSASATGGTLGKTFEKVSNTEWTLTVKEPAATGYYNIFIEAADRSAQNNMGSEGVAPADIATDFFERDGDVNSGDAHYFQGDINLPNPGVWVSGQRIEDTEPAVEFKTPLFVELDFTSKYIDDCAPSMKGDERDANCYAESDEYAKDSFDSVKVTSFTLNGTDITDSVKTTDNETFLVSIDGISIGDHKIEVQALDEAGNDFDDTLTIEFEVEERDAFSKRLSPGWNLVSLPGEPADSSIGVVFGSDIEVRTVYTYDPIMPGGWMVAVRESVDSDWQGDLKEITARRGYWVLSDAIQDWDVSIPRLAGGAVGSGTPIQPPVIALYAGWNLVPVIDVTGDFAGSGISAKAYLQSLDDGLDLARVLGFDTITNSWSTVMAPETGTADTLEYGKAYWVFVRQAASLVPGN